MTKWEFLTGDIKIKKTKLPEAMLAGILGVIFLYVSVAGMVSYATPWLQRGDTDRHIDYVYRIRHGDIPRWSDGIQYPPFVQLEGHKNQGVSANPPLFYMIHAPIIGPLLDEGKWQSAIAVGRAINIFIGVLCALALAWAGWLFGGNRRALFAVAVPALAVLMYRFTRLNVDFALDALLVLWATLSLIFDYKLLQHGLKPRYLLAIAVVSVLGMATKAPYIIFLLASALTIVLACLLHGKKSTVKNILKAGLISFSLFVLVALAIGWFYYFRNHKAYGSWFSQSPAGYTGGRPYQSLMDVLTNKKLWGLWYTNYSSSAVLSITMTSFAVAGWFGIRKKAVMDYLKNRIKITAVLLLVLVTVGTFLIQIKFGTRYGSINFRYMLPASLPISLFLSYGLLSWHWARGQILFVAVLAMGSTSAFLAGGRNIHKLYAATTQNGVPDIVPTIFIVLFAVGAGLLSRSLFVLSKNHR